MKSVKNGTKRDSVNDLDYRKIIKLKKSEIELKEYVQQDRARKELSDIINAQRQGQFARQLFNSSEIRKPGSSPVRDLIKG